MIVLRWPFTLQLFRSSIEVHSLWAYILCTIPRVGKRIAHHHRRLCRLMRIVVVCALMKYDEIKEWAIKPEWSTRDTTGTIIRRCATSLVQCTNPTVLRIVNVADPLNFYYRLSSGSGMLHDIQHCWCFDGDRIQRRRDVLNWSTWVGRQADRWWVRDAHGVDR